ncbi:hypothetical protein MCUN1_001571 [Malassezia cuniculi]|uniref:Uncharacterized protein n=1 Tax=Malassezia cuniculi TaxID=948313 RepID=A0AAF0EUA4_9BASI|nr:hypothetical protein MCUN1_001571 [Malassezia cuniculi]
MLDWKPAGLVMSAYDDVLQRMMRALETPPLDDVPALSHQRSFDSVSSFTAPTLTNQDGVWYRIHDMNDISTDSARRRPFDFAELQADPDMSAVALAVTSDLPQEPLHRVAHNFPGYVSALQYRRSTTGERGSMRPTTLARFGAKLAGLWRPESPADYEKYTPPEPPQLPSTPVKSRDTAISERPSTPLAAQIARRRSNRATPPRRKPVPADAEPIPAVPALAMLAPAVRGDESTFFASAMSADDSIVANGTMVAMPRGSAPGRIATRPPPRPPKSALRAIRAVRAEQVPPPAHISPVPSLSDGSDDSDIEVVAYAIDEPPVTQLQGLNISLPKMAERNSAAADASLASLF